MRTVRLLLLLSPLALAACNSVDTKDAQAGAELPAPGPSGLPATFAQRDLSRPEEARSLFDGSVAASSAGGRESRTLPDAPTAFTGETPSEFGHVDPDGVVPAPMLRAAENYLAAHASSFPNRDWMTLIDYSQPSGRERMYLVNMRSGEVTTHLVSHGRGSDPDHDGYADRFSNREGSHATSLGLYRTAEMYEGKNGLSMRLDGLEASNSNARDRDIVMHGADYVAQGRRIQGRSHGCPAVQRSELEPITERIAGGSLLYMWSGGSPAS